MNINFDGVFFVSKSILRIETKESLISIFNLALVEKGR